MMIVSRGSVFGSAGVQDALINELAKRFQCNPDTNLKESKALISFLRRFSNIAASRELGALEFQEISEIVHELIGKMDR